MGAVSTWEPGGCAGRAGAWVGAGETLEDWRVRPAAAGSGTLRGAGLGAEKLQDKGEEVRREREVNCSQVECR